jgi:hypothetical protein
LMLMKDYERWVDDDERWWKYVVKTYICQAILPNSSVRIGGLAGLSLFGLNVFQPLGTAEQVQIIDEKSRENPCGTCGNNGHQGAAWTGNPHQLAVSRSPLSCAVQKKQGEDRIVT